LASPLFETQTGICGSLRIGGILVANRFKQTRDRSTRLRMPQNSILSLIKVCAASSCNLLAVKQDVKAVGTLRTVIHRNLLSIDRELSSDSKRHLYTPRSMVRSVHSQVTFRSG
jgi:hypothetical protein